MLTPVDLRPLNETPLVSVLVSSYNYERYIGATLESVVRQSYGRFEAIVCDDGSSDGSAAIIARFCERDERIRLLRQANAGQAAALNAAYHASSGEIVCFLDSDDMFETRKLEEIVARFRRGDSGAIVHPLLLIDAGGAELGQIPNLGRFEVGWIAPQVVRRGGRWRYMPTGGLALRREVAELVFNIPVNFTTSPDGFVFTLMPFLTRVDFIDHPLSRFRIHEGNHHRAGTEGPDIAAANARRWEEIISAVNARLATLGRAGDGTYLEVRRNIAFREQLYFRELLAGDRSPGHLVTSWLELAKLVAHDDLYTSTQKVLAIGLFGSALIVPTRFRGRWVRWGWDLAPRLRRRQTSGEGTEGSH